MEVAWDIRFSHKTGYFLMGGPQEIISCLLSHEKISCLMRFSHGIYKEGMRHEIFSWDRRFSCGEGPPKRKSAVSCLMRKSHVSRDFLMGFMEKAWDIIFSHETGDFVMGVPPGENLLSPVSWENFMSHEIFSWDISRLHETWDFLVRQEIFLWGGAPMRKSPVFCLMR